MRNKINRDKTILGIDDDREIREKNSYLLKQAGYSVATASCGQAAIALLDLLEQYGLSLVLMNIMMRQIDSSHILSLIRQHSNIPIIMLAENYEQNSLQKALALSANGYIKKSFCQSELVTSIRTILGRDEKTTTYAYSESFVAIPLAI